MILALAVASSGAVGAVARLLVDGFVQDRTSGVVPFGTLAVNVIGSFVMGVLGGVVLFHHVGGPARAVAGVGLCGGLTTWGGLSWETVRLHELRGPRTASWVLVVGIATSLAAGAVGLALAAS